MKELIRVCILSLVILFISCGKNKQDGVEEAIRFRYYNLENAGWKSRMHSQKVDDVDFTATEVPIQYYLLKSEGKQDLKKIDSIYEKNKTERVLEFTFEDLNQEDLLQEKFTSRDYESSIKYMSFEIEKDFYVVTTKHDTVPCSGSLFERTFKISPKSKLLLFFSNIDPNEKIQLVYQDKLFKKGTLKFRFKDPLLKL